MPPLYTLFRVSLIRVVDVLIGPSHIVVCSPPLRSPHSRVYDRCTSPDTASQISVPFASRGESATGTAVYDAGFHGFGSPCGIPQPAERPAPIGLISVGRKVVVGLSRKWFREVCSGSRGVAVLCLGGSVQSPCVQLA